jgi:hypothetical protein
VHVAESVFLVALPGERGVLLQNEVQQSLDHFHFLAPLPNGLRL